MGGIRGLSHISGAHGSLLALCLGINSDGYRGNYDMPGIQSRSATSKAKVLPAVVLHDN